MNESQPIRRPKQVSPPREPIWLTPGPKHTNNIFTLDGESLTLSQVVWFLLLHAPLMLIFQTLPILATAHSIFMLLLGFHFLIRDQKATRVAWVLGYLAGAEILWRGLEATIVWEYGKYATILLAGFMILKARAPHSPTVWPVLFVGLLVPGIFIAPHFDREMISYQLAGLVALAVATMAFSTLEFRKPDLQRLFLFAIAPVMSVSFLTIYYLVTQDIRFYGGGANEQITGGIGANQVASALSFGATVAFFYIFLALDAPKVRNLMLGLLVGFTVLSILTFSRSGLWNTVGAVAIGLFFLAQDRLRASRVLMMLVQFTLIGYFLLFPFLLNLTSGTFLDRFSDFDSTGRDKLVEIDYQLFLDNPVTGVGVGRSPYYHIAYFGYPKNTHTEYFRLLAEHGSLGVAAIGLLAAITIRRFLKKQKPFEKSVTTAFTVWMLLYLAHSATRMVAPSFAFALAAAKFLPEEESEDDPLARPYYHRR